MSDNQPPQPPPSSSTSNKATTNTSSSTNNNITTTYNQNESLTSRIQSSASSLARNALFTPSPGDIAKNLPGSSSTTKAGAPPSSSAAASAAQTYHAETSAPSSSARGISESGIVGDSFRSSATGTGKGQDGLTEEAYQFQDAYHTETNGGLQLQQPGLSVYDTDTDIKGKGKGKAQEPEQDHHEPFENTWQSVTTTATSSQNAQDGSEVLTLLTSPSFNTDFPGPEPALSDDSLIPNDLSTDKTPFELSPTEIQILDSFRRNLGPDPTQQGQQRNLHSASLVPDIGDFLDTIPPATQNDATALRDAVLTGLPGAEDWVAVEERYQDEVWGYLKPVLEEARREMEEKEDSGQGQGLEGEDGPAVARLKMILRHMRA